MRVFQVFQVSLLCRQKNLPSNTLWNLTDHYGTRPGYHACCSLRFSWLLHVARLNFVDALVLTTTTELSPHVRMQLMSIQRSEVSFNSAILACSRARQWQMTLELFGNLQLSSLEVDVMCLGKVVKGQKMSDVKSKREYTVPGQQGPGADCWSLVFNHKWNRDGLPPVGFGLRVSLAENKIRQANCALIL